VGSPPRSTIPRVLRCAGGEKQEVKRSVGEIIKQIFGKTVRITCPSMTEDGRCKLESTWCGYPPCIAPECRWGRVEILEMQNQTPRAEVRGG